MKNDKGFTLFEVMIALFVLSIGLLGLAGLQLTGLKNNHSAQMRTEATIHAYDMLERMRINKVAAAAGEYNIGLEANGDGDVAAWKASLSSALPIGKGAIATNGDGLITITIQWDDSRGSEGSATQAFTVSTLL